MSRARIQLQPAWVLKAAPYGDTSLLLECLSREHGRVGLVARGARGHKTRARALLQAFQPLLLSWSESGDLGRLTASESAGPAVVLAGERVFSGWYLNELLLRALHRHDTHPEVFAAYSEALAELALDPRLGEAALRRFESRLLSALGFGVELSENLAPDAGYVWDPDSGLREVTLDTPGAVQGRHLAGLQLGVLESEEQLRAARLVLRAALAPLLGSKPLASATMLRQLRRSADARTSPGRGPPSKGAAD